MGDPLSFQIFKKSILALVLRKNDQKVNSKAQKPRKNHNLSKTAVKRKQSTSYYLLFFFNLMDTCNE